MASSFRKGPSTHKTIRCTDCGATKLVVKLMVGNTKCACGCVYRTAASEDK